MVWHAYLAAVGAELVVLFCQETDVVSREVEIIEMQ